MKQEVVRFREEKHCTVDEQRKELIFSWSKQIKRKRGIGSVGETHGDERKE